VYNDLLLAGGTVYINGYVADDIRCAGGELHILKSIGGDLVIAGGKVDIAKQVFVAGGLMTSGGDVVLNGTINSDVRSNAGTFTFNGKANRNFNCRSEKLIINGTVTGNSVLAARQITIGNNASLNNNVRYWTGHGNFDFKQSIKSGNAVYDPSLKLKTKSWYYLGQATMLGFFWYLGSVFIFILLIQYLFGRTIKKAGDNLSGSIFKSLGWGFIFFIGVPILVLLLLITIIGIPVGLMLMFSYIALIVLATIITSLVSANWYNNRFQMNWGFWQTVLTALGMFILLKIITFTPFLGWLFMLVIAATAFGSILRNINWRRNQKIAIQ
jgi:hypothetical protein